MDFYHFWAVPAALRDGGLRDVYAPPAREAFGRYMAERVRAQPGQRIVLAHEDWVDPQPTATPLLYATFAGLVGDDYEADYRRFQRAALALAGIGILLAGHAAGLPIAASLGVAGWAALWFAPLHSEVRVANVARVLLFLMAAYVALRLAAARSRQRAALSVASGFVLASAVLFKPMLVFCVATLGINRLLQRQWRDFWAESAGALAAAVVALLATGAAFGSVTVWGAWLGNLGAIVALGPHALADGNFALGAWLTAVTGLPGAIAFGLAVLVLGAQAAILGRAGWEPPDAAASARIDAAAVLLGFVVYCMTAPLVWFHYYVLALPLLLLALGDAWRLRKPWLAAPAVLAVFALREQAASAAMLALLALAGASLLALRAQLSPPPGFR